MKNNEIYLSVNTPFMKNKYRKYSKNEKILIDRILLENFSGSENLKSQIQSCDFIEVLDDQGSIGFNVEKKEEYKINTKERVIIEGQVIKENSILFFMVHIKDGYILELETYNSNFEENDIINNLSEDEISKMVFF